REKMYKTSGHLPYYAESMFPPMELQAEGKVNVKIQQNKIEELKVLEDIRKHFENFVPRLKENPSSEEVAEMVSQIRSYLAKDEKEKFDEVAYSRLGTDMLQAWFNLVFPIERYYLKAMNCPHHHRIFAAEPRSYRDLPLRLAEYGTCYRYEQSGELFGLMRVRSLNMNDAHIYCTPEQFAAEFNAVNEMYLKYFKVFGIEKYVMRFSTHSAEGLGKKYVDEPALWKQTEDMVRKVLIDSKIPYVEVPNEAAFYGPKIDVQVWSVIGREFTLATNQVDFAVPAKFGLKYRDRDNSEKTPLCIHRAPLGTHERFIGFLIEHYAGNFPLWLAPEQVRVLTLGEDEKLIAYAKSIVDELRGNFVRCESDFGNDPVKAKIAEAEQAKVHTMLVIGGRDMDAGAVSVRLHGKGNVGAKPKGEVVADILAAIKERRA
ncbi:MAG TPA: threonine--tRNA ligase, partial [Dongiaceae bacterium]|nr:threonine--tRNA ligase [Dongiaceae bacterium]